MVRAPKPVRRCAIYTRKSSEEGLEQDFNSLHAQREACEAYVHSQAGEGWRVIGTAYDDGGYSGGTTDRPALTRLLDDIQSDKIDTVVVYKVDRLTRSLADFARIVSVFDAADVAFVSVTQSFNTTTSMGRLTLNMLLSFAQFEREVTGERIRDKISASKQRGLWMGGFVPLGYEPNGRTLTINQAEAETVRTIFRLYRDLGTVRAVKTEADRLGLTTKKRVSASGGVSGALPMSRGYLYKLLGNPLYVGRIPHKDTSYPGQHPAIIDQELWEDVQAQLADKTHARRRGKTIKAPSPLAGKLNHADGEPLTPSHAVKSGRRYRYYISRSLVSRSGEPADPTQGWRLPAGEVERITSRAVMSLLTTPAKLTDAARTAGLPSTSIAGLLHRAARWSGDPLSLVEHARIRPFAIDLTLDLGELNPDGPLSITHTIDVQLKRRGVETKLVIPTDEPSNARRTTDPALAKAITRAHRWFEALATGQATSIADVAKSENLTDRYVSRLLPLAFLAPDITEAVLDGRQPRHLTVEYLLQNIDLPIDWSEQRQLLGLA